MAVRIARLVVGVENNFQVLKAGLTGEPLPENLLPVLADARAWPYHAGYTAGVLLMRHCRREDFMLYVRKLRESGCLRLITNARWGLGVEEVPLTGSVAYESLEMGWYGCVICGQAGFKEGDPAKLVPGMDAVINVEGCPSCRDDRESYA